MGAKRKRSGTKLPRYVQRRKRADGSFGYRGWVGDGFGGHRWQPETVDSPEEAHRWAVAQRQQRKVVPATTIRFADAVDHVRAEMRLKGRRDGTLEWFDSAIAAPLAAWQSSILLSSITAPGVRKFIELRRRQGISSARLDHHRRALRRVLRWGLKHGYLLANPLDTVDWPAVEDRDVQFYRPDEADELVRLMADHDAPSAQDDALLVQFLLTTGARRREAAAITREDLVETNDGQFVTLRRTAKAGKSRTRHVPFAATGKAEGLFEQLAARTRPGELVFPGGIHAVSRTFRRWRPSVRRWRRKSGEVIEREVPGRLPDKLTVSGDEDGRRWRFHPHACRHTFVTTLVYGDRHSVFEIQQFAGHRNIQITADYFHLIPGASARLAGL